MSSLGPAEDPIDVDGAPEPTGAGPPVAADPVAGDPAAVDEARAHRAIRATGSGVHGLDIHALDDHGLDIHGLDIHGQRPARWPLVAAVVAALAVLIGGSLLWLGRPGDQVRTVPVTVAVSAPAQRALDCPDGIECFLGPAQPATVTLMRRDFPGAQLRDGWRTILGRTGETVRETVRADAPGELAITVQARCVPGGSPIAASTSRSVEPGGRQQLIVVVPGEAGGCSVAVVVEGPAGTALPEAAATALAHASSLQLG